MVDFIIGIVFGVMGTIIAWVLFADDEVKKIERMETSIYELYESAITALKVCEKEAIMRFAERLKENYSQADILCPRRIVSLTEKELEELVEEMTEDGEEDA